MRKDWTRTEIAKDRTRTRRAARSRNAGNDPGNQPGKRSLNWRVTLKHRGADILTTDYGAGIAHCPAYSRLKIGSARGWTLEQVEAITYETEKGKRAPRSASMPIGGAAILPDPEGVIYSLALDAGALDFATYEAWAADFGYDPDSRKGEAIYRACLEIALKLRSAIGEEGIRQLREAAQDY